MKCPTCEQHDLVPGETDYSHNVGGEKVSVMVSSENCPGCGESLTGCRALQAGERTISFGFLREGENLTGPRLRFIRKTLGLRVPHLADILDLDESRLARWEKGEEALLATDVLAIVPRLRSLLSAPDPTETP